MSHSKDPYDATKYFGNHFYFILTDQKTFVRRIRRTKPFQDFFSLGTRKRWRHPSLSRGYARESVPSTYLLSIVKSKESRVELRRRETRSWSKTWSRQYSLTLNIVGSVNRFGEISPLWRYFINIWPFIDGLDSIWQQFEHLLANYLCFRANGNCCKWPNIEHIIKPSGHTDSR